MSTAVTCWKIQPGMGREESDKVAAEKGDHQNVARAALVIDTLAGAREQGLRLTDVVEKTGLGTATIHRLLAGLVAYGFVDLDKASNRYFVGLKMISWTAAAIERYGLAPYADSALDRLCRQTEDTVYLSLRSGNDAVCVDRREGSYPIRTLTLALGDRRPLGVGAGSLALLAFQSDAFVDEVLSSDVERRNAVGIGTDLVERLVGRARENGFALNEGLLIPGMSGVAVPILDHDRRAVAAISVAAITSRLSGERLHAVVEDLKAAAVDVETGAVDILGSPLAKRFSVRKG